MGALKGDFHFVMSNVFVNNALTRIIGQWWNRLLGAAKEGSFSDQDEMYASHRTSRDYICNMFGIATWGMVFPVLTVVITQLTNAELAGMFSLAFITATLLMMIGNYGVRTYQVSDIDERHSFADYEVNRFITCALMMVVGVGYCMVRGYGGDMLTISIGVYFYRMIDALADVYEGRLQQQDKFYLAGISQAVRSVLVVLFFSLALLITRNVGVASIVMAVVAALTFVFLTFPLGLIETPKSPRCTFESVVVIFKQCFPLFLAVFLFNLIESMPKFVMEGVLPYDSQLYFNALYFPAQGIMLAIQLVYKPLLVRLTKEWADPSRRKRFDLAFLAMMGVVLAFTGVTAVLMGWIGIPLMSWIYGLDFEPYRGLAYVMVAAGGVTAAVDFLYQVITVLRRQGDVTKLYFITFGFSVFVPILLINFTGLPGAVIGYLIVMAILLSLLAMEYITIRVQFSHGAVWQEDDEALGRTPTLPVNPAMSGRIDISQADALRIRQKTKKAMHSAREQVKTGKTNVVRSHGSHAESTDGPARTTRVHGNIGQASPRVRVSGATVASTRASSDAEARERERKARVRAQLMEQAAKEKQRASEVREYEDDTQALAGRHASRHRVVHTRPSKNASSRGRDTRGKHQR